MWVMVETLGHSHPKYKTSFKVKISSTRPPPWAWGATSVPYSFGSTLGLGSCKRFEKNQLIPSKPHFFSFPHKSYGFGPCLKYNIIHELSPQGSRAWLNRVCRKCVAKMGINKWLFQLHRSTKLTCHIICCRFSLFFILFPNSFLLLYNLISW